MNKKFDPFLSVIVPAYLQEKTIAADLKNIAGVLENTGRLYELIVVVDGRTDKTFENAKILACGKIRVFSYQKNQGKGFAVRFGMKKARGNYIAFLDAGMEIDPSGLPLLLEHMFWYDSDIIVGSVRHSASQVTGYPLIRRIYSFGYHFLTRLLFGFRITDCQRGIKIFKKKVLVKVLPRLLVKRYAFDVEMLAAAHRLGFKKIHDGPVKMDASKLHYSGVYFGTVWSMLIDTLAVFYRLKILRYYDDDYRRRSKYNPDLGMKVNIG